LCAILPFVLFAQQQPDQPGLSGGVKAQQPEPLSSLADLQQHFGKPGAIGRGERE